MEKLFEIISLAFIQGLTEFLPVSSSGHLAILGKFLHLEAEENLTIAIVLHLGSLTAIVFFYFKTLISLLKKENHRVIALVALASIPSGIVGVLLKKSGLADGLFDSPILVAIGFFITAFLLYFSERSIQKSESTGTIVNLNQIGYLDALKIGLVQMAAITPGISRSGSTISAGLWCKLDRQTAAAFSFLMAIPAIAGGGLLEVMKFAKMGVQERSAEMPDIAVLAIGFVVSALVSFGALALLVRLLKKGSWVFFSYYLVLAGLTTLIFWSFFK